ncbi:IMP dehydrogenase [Actinobaculum suis]|uniref:IMP dehydrogenase n=1 Tax=Actinobaculum suis TaxID=1657 RepID=A0A1G7ATK2_9ACTO|nr:GuaB3 family IMP dehydrogenase-related protein [Actinobaculum suis]MDY5153429.1 GuaB3 family IMP dehydrogenase-related protein [Actinobaculum suis]SDE17877.1 IMP dehydrogenase [Actinobaculum suis]
MSEVEIGRGKRARITYTLDDIAVVPRRRTRDVREVSTAWQLDAYHLDIPVMAAPMDSVGSPEMIVELGKMGGVGVLDLEGLWTRYENPSEVYAEIARTSAENSNAVLQRLYAAEPIKNELIGQRLTELRDAGVVVAGACSPGAAKSLVGPVQEAGLDLFVIRGTTVSAEHVSTTREPLNLRTFIYDLDIPVIVGGAVTYQGALHLMRTGAAGVLAGYGGGAASQTLRTVGIAAPMATTIAEIAAARRDYLDESGGRYVHVIADGSLGTSGDVVKAIACGADGLMLGTMLARAAEAPGAGWHWGPEARHPRLPRGERVYVGTAGSLEEVLFGPTSSAQGHTNIMGALRHAMSATGYSDIKEFQRADLSVVHR